MKARVRSSQVVLSDDMKPLNRSLELAFRLDERLYWEYVPRLLRRYKLRIIQVFKVSLTALTGPLLLGYKNAGF